MEHKRTVLCVAYYEYVNDVILAANRTGGKAGVYSALKVLKWEIYTGSIW